MASERAAWIARRAGLDPRKLVFIDESSAKTNMTRLYGRAPCGQRLVEKVPHGHWNTTTFIAGLRCDGIVAPMLLGGAMDGIAFVEYVRQVLTPILKHGDIVVMDNLPVHKVAGVKEVIEKVGARVLYLPPYSYDFNPIEKMFAKWKELLRKTKSRTQESLWNSCGELLQKFSPTECLAYFHHCGYAATGK